MSPPSATAVPADPPVSFGAGGVLPSLASLPVLATKHVSRIPWTICVIAMRSSVERVRAIAFDSSTQQQVAPDDADHVRRRVRSVPAQLDAADAEVSHHRRAGAEQRLQ